MLEGGDGADTLIGDNDSAVVHAYVGSAADAWISNVYTGDIVGGDDTLRGNGNDDLLIGDNRSASTFAGLDDNQSYLSSARSGSIIGGDDRLRGGGGSDTHIK